MKRLFSKTILKGMAIAAIPLLVIVSLLSLYFLEKADPWSSIFLSEQNSISDQTWTQIQDDQRKVRQDPENVPLLVSLARDYLQGIRENADSTSYDRVTVLLAIGEKIEPNNTDIAFLKAQMLLGKHHFVEALPVAEYLLKAHPDAAAYYGVLADAQIELGKYTEATNTLQTMVDLKPNSNAYTRIAYLRELTGDTDGAIEMMENALESGNNVNENLAWNFSELGRLWLGKDLGKAEVSYQNALKAYPDFPLALEGLGKIAAAKGNLDQALQDFQKAFDILPLPQFGARISEVYEKMGNHDKALVYEKLVEVGYAGISSKGTDTDLEWAQFLAFHDLKPEQALTLARSAYEKRPNIFAADVLSWALSQNHQIEEAKTMSKNALKTGSKNALILYHFCVINRDPTLKKNLCKAPLLGTY